MTRQDTDKPEKQTQATAQATAQAKRAILFTLGFFALSTTMIVVGRQYFGLDGAQVNAALSELSNSVWALPMTIAVFCAAAFIGAPQWMLISASVLAFGPVLGGVYAWTATLISAASGFCIARALGAQRLSAMSTGASSGLFSTLAQAVRKNGFVTSFVVRLVPTGPFIMVNFAAGLSNMKFTAFLAGTALGIIPKILVLVLIGLGVISGLSKSAMALIFAALAAVVAVVIIYAQKRLKA